MLTQTAFIGFDIKAKKKAGKNPKNGPIYGTISNNPVINPITIAKSIPIINNNMVTATPTYKDINNRPLINCVKEVSIVDAIYNRSFLCLLGIKLIIFSLK